MTDSSGFHDGLCPANIGDGDCLCLVGTVERLKDENVKLRAEVARLETLKVVYRELAFDLQAKLRTADLQNDDLKKSAQHMPTILRAVKYGLEYTGEFGDEISTAITAGEDVLNPTVKRVEESPKPYQRGDDVSDDAMRG